MSKVVTQHWAAFSKTIQPTVGIAAWRVARLIRQEFFRVPGVPCGLANGERTVTTNSSRPLRDELVKLAEKSLDLKIIWIKAPKHREWFCSNREL
jgi:hypothetical protein